MTSMCFSGGAQGADHVWGMVAVEHGHDLIHFSFDGHKSVDSKHTHILTRSELDESDPYVTAAATSIYRRFPSRNPHVNDLLRRNYYQIRWAERVYAVASLVPKDKSMLQISGGTAWACQMYVDKCTKMGNQDGCELYLYDMTSNKWMKWCQLWKEIPRPPVPHGHYAAIGSRELTDAGIRAISQVYELMLG